MYQHMNRGEYESPCSETMELTQERGFLTISEKTLANPTWGGNNRSGSDLAGDADDVYSL